MQETLESINREKEIEKNKREAIEIAAKIFKIVTNPSFANELDADQRHYVCVEKNKGFAQAFPLVLSKMARDFAYSEKAFRRFLDKLHKDPGKGMDGLIERQADYAAYLYEELCREQGKHYNMKTRRDIYQSEYQQMHQWMKDIKKQEKQAKNELEEESKKSLDERKNELLEFLNEAESTNPEPKQSLAELMQADDDYINMLRTTSDTPQSPDQTQEHDQKQEPSQEPKKEPTQTQTSDLKFPDYSGYAEVQKLNQIQPAVAEALGQRRQAIAQSQNNDWLNDSNVPGWKQKKTKKR